MSGLIQTILFTVLCLVVPILWGVFINWLFNLWQSKTAEKPQDEPVFPDYQI